MDIESLQKQLAEMQAAQALLMRQIAEAKAAAEAQKTITLTVTSFIANGAGNVNFILSDYRKDLVDAFRVYTSHRYNNYNKGNILSAFDWAKFKVDSFNIPNFTIEYKDPSIEKAITNFLTAPIYTVEMHKNYFSVAIAERARSTANVFYKIASAKMNHVSLKWEIAHSDAIGLWNALEPHSQDTVWDKDSLEYIEKAITQKSAADEVAAKKVSEKYSPARFPNMMYSLKDYQTVSQEFADVTDDRIILSDGMGLGKSPQAIYRAINKGWATIFITPAGLVENWRREIVKFTGIEPLIFRGMREPHPIEMISAMRKEHKLVILPMSTFGYNLDNDKGEKSYPWADFVNLTMPDLVVIDEGHYLSNPSAARGAAAQRLNTKRIWVMTGTPLKNKVKDMIVLGKIVRPDMFPSIERAVDAYTTNNGRDVRNLEKLQDMFRQFMLRRTQRDVYSPEDMKEKHFYEKAYTLSEEDKKAYNNIMEGLLTEINTITGEIEEKDIPNILVQFLRLKQLCSMSKVSEVVELANEIADSQDSLTYEIGKNWPKTIIFTQFVEVAKALKVELGSRAILVTGESHSVSARMDAITRFESDPNIPFYIGTIQAHQEGLTITGAGTHIYVDYPWTAASLDQAHGRSYMRTNDPHGLEIYETVIPGSIEDHVRSIIAHKRALADSCVDGTEAARVRGSSIVKEVIERMKRQAYLK